MKEQIHGFTLKQTKYVKELNAEVYIYRHDRTGARLMHIDADDTNKVFSIGFLTPPTDHTGVAHITEHSVLCGSKKYPTKEPFVELLKGSLYTFLNAYTDDDNTCYPVASVNDKDFEILVGVYLDAVFFPNLLHTDEIFMQEGWHYEMLSADDELTIKGVVYNEMQGYFANPRTVLAQKLSEVLLPDTPYYFNSGGIPLHIPELTLQKFREFHRTFYHPSNACIYLYGKMDIEHMLGLIDGEALSHFTQSPTSDYQPQKPFASPIETECVYPLTESEDPTGKTWFALDFVLQLEHDDTLEFSFEVITHLLLHTPAAPLKNAFLQAGICKDVFGYFSSNGKHPRFTVILKDSDLQYKDQAKQLFFDTLADICKKGIDKQLIEASINVKEFDLREGDTGSYPKGFVYIGQSMPDWLHNLDPIRSLCYESKIEATQVALSTDLYEQLISKHILQNPHYAFATMTPDPGLSERTQNELKEKLSSIKSQMSASEIEKIVSTTQKLIERQQGADTPADLQKIPVLQISDVDPKAFDFSLEQTATDGIHYLQHAIFTNGICYLRLFFENNAIPQHLLPYTQALSFLLGKIHTEKYHYAELATLINIHTGGIGSDFSIYEDYHHSDKYNLLFSIGAKVLTHKTPQLIDLISEITNHTLFTDKKRLQELLNELKSSYEMYMMQAGTYFASKRLAAYHTETSKIEEVIEGVEFFLFLKNLLKDFDSKADEIMKNFQTVYQMLFNKKHLYVSITSAQADIDNVKTQLKPWTDTLKAWDTQPVKYHWDFCQPNEAFVLPGSVQYIVKGYNFNQLGHKYSGDMEVLKIICQLDYLWNTIRVQGGAYGANISINAIGSCYATSFRDPNLLETLNAYSNIHRYLREVEISEREFTKYVIGAVRKFDQPKTPVMIGSQSDTYFFMHKSQQDLQSQRNQLLNAKIETIKSYADMLQQVMDKNIYCVFGSAQKIKENKGIFSKVVEVFGS